jgi:2-oxoglutarate/2-oxoacid ferredoxin oxidoreductase subunit alpha
MKIRTKKKSVLKSNKVAAKNGISILIAGEAGQGIQTIETLLVNIFKRTGHHVFATKEYMSRVRGGVNSTQIRVSDHRVSAWTEKIDLFIPLGKDSLARLKPLITADTVIIGEHTESGDDRVMNIPFNDIALQAGNKLYAGVAAAGAVCGMLKVEKDKALGFIQGHFNKKGEESVKGNSKAFTRGYSEGEILVSKIKNQLILTESPGIEDEILLSGADAVALGAIAGGCDAVFAYPMTPSTGVFTSLAAYSHKAGIVVEQVEDEIGVINMALGASYAGARALVSTSGGGYDLMTEGISLAGMIETPVVVHLGQRPGPATGLPTRTEQGDFNLAVYTGHGVFGRVVLAPGDTRQAFELTMKAFDIADRFQVPVFILTDQYFVDSYYNIPSLPDELIRIPEKRHILETDASYQRYALTKDGISPRGIPGFGVGKVCCDSDEHDQEGRITEDLDGIVMAMKRKRLAKIRGLERLSHGPNLYGPRKFKTLVVGWGSVKNIILEALESGEFPDTAFLHFTQVFPLPSKARKYLEKARKIVAVENNQTGQFAQFLEGATGIRVPERILKYNGLQFTVEELRRELKKIKKKMN